GPGPGPGPGPAVRPPPRPRCPSRTSGHLLGARRAFAVPPVAGGGVVGADRARGDGAALGDPRTAGGTAPVRSPRRHRARGGPADSRTPGAGASVPGGEDRAARGRAPARRDRRTPARDGPAERRTPGRTHLGGADGPAVREQRPPRDRTRPRRDRPNRDAGRRVG